MIRINRILIDCDNWQLTVESHEKLETFRNEIAANLNIEPSQILLTYEEPTNNEQH